MLPRCGADGGSFQSTLPTRGSDAVADYNNRRCGVSIHAPHEGERPISNKPPHSIVHVSIHAPHEGERRCVDTGGQYARARFNPRSPRGGATTRPPRRGVGENVSIHAPHEGERRRKSAFVCSISANLLNIIHCGTVTRAVSRRRIALFRLFSVRRSGVFMYAYASH